VRSGTQRRLEWGKGEEGRRVLRRNFLVRGSDGRVTTSIAKST
jgi:hypothetical protein